MHTDTYGQQVYSEADLCALYMKEPGRTIRDMLVNKNIEVDPSLELKNAPGTIKYFRPKISVTEFDNEAQANWFMPKEYYDMDIAKWVLDQCKTEAALQRAGSELLEYNSRGMLPLLQYMKYLVDIMRRQNIVWGVGRGSSVSSYVLFLIGIHRIDSLYYDLSISEFLK